MAERAAKSPEPVPSAREGRYEIGELIAAGGMGSVHRAFDRFARRTVAYKRLKVASESARSRFAALFRREYDTLVHLSHPNIVEAYEFGFDASGPYYTMELLSGDDLSRLAPLPVREACRVLRDIASALALIHARRLVHRDVSLNNVRLTADGRAKLIDFVGLTPFGVPNELVGTAAFIAPECLTAAPLDARTDLYALGVLAYWTLTARMCVRARNIDELIGSWDEPILPPSHYVPEVPAALDELVLSLLSREPVARPASAAHVIERLTTSAELAPEQDEQRVAYSYLQHPPLRGREQVVAELQHALRKAVAGNGQIVLLTAEQGLGRSALLDHLAVEAQLSGATVLRAQGGLHTAPFSAARTLVQAGLGTFPDVALRLRERGSVFKQLDGSGPDARVVVRSTIDISERQALMSSQLADALLELSLCNAIVLLVDDAHAVDAESLSLFASMLESVEGHPLLLALSARSGVTAQHPQAFAKLEANAERYKLTALSEQHVGELVGTMFGGVPNTRHLAVWLSDQTGGNPAHCLDQARLLLARGEIRYTVGTFTLPYDFGGSSASERQSEALLANLSGLTPEAQDVAYFLGMHIGPLTSALLASASGLGTREVLLALEELAQRGVAVSSEDSYSCASEALRAALSSSRPGQQTRAAHLALAKAFALRNQDVLVDRLATARHLLNAGGDAEFQGACLLAGTADEHKFDMATSRPTLGLLEQALQVLEAHGISDQESLGLLVPLSLAGFYGELELQRTYLERTMRALSSICGVTLAVSLRRWLGGRLALVLGILGGLIAFVCSRRTLNRRTFLQHFEAFGGLPGSASAAAACVWDVPESYRIAAWLDPFQFASKRSALYLMREFCMANAELVSVKLATATDRYSRLFSTFEKPVFGLVDAHAEQFRCGCLHGKAQALVTNTAPLALEVADELARRSTFFSPHAEGVRMTYHAFRGEARQAAEHRARAEALAFRGGTSWSATSVLTIRSVQACVMTGDVVGLVHVVADLERLAKISDSMNAIFELAQAHLEQLRGQPERAVASYERVFAREIARRLPSYPVERSLHARALSALGDFAAAKALCLALIEEVQSSGRDSDHIHLLVYQQLALAEAGLGNSERAVELLEGCFTRAQRHENPLSLGMIHRQLALLAARKGDSAGFEQHFTAMTQHFGATENPRLLQQCDVLRAEAVRLGVLVRAAVGEAPGAQDFFGETAIVTRADARPTVLEGSRGR
jgi:tRNA A-37 threonylcarbamoyl transferase component Bud32/tetratricopeptide (TPR) repeat protein